MKLRSLFNKLAAKCHKATAMLSVPILAMGLGLTALTATPEEAHARDVSLNLAWTNNHGDHDNVCLRLWSALKSGPALLDSYWQELQSAADPTNPPGDDDANVRIMELSGHATSTPFTLRGLVSGNNQAVIFLTAAKRNAEGLCLGFINGTGIDENGGFNETQGTSNVLHIISGDVTAQTKYSTYTYDAVNRISTGSMSRTEYVDRKLAPKLPEVPVTDETAERIAFCDARVPNRALDTDLDKVPDFMECFFGLNPNKVHSFTGFLNDYQQVTGIAVGPDGNRFYFYKDADAKPRVGMFEDYDLDGQRNAGDVEPDLCITGTLYNEANSLCEAFTAVAKTALPDGYDPQAVPLNPLVESKLTRNLTRFYNWLNHTPAP